MGTSIIERTMQEELQQTKKCAYCSKEMENDAIKCPHCHSLIPEVKNPLIGWGVSLVFFAFMVALTAAVFVRIALVRHWTGVVSWDVGLALRSPMFIAAAAVSIIVAVVSIIQINKLGGALKRYNKGILSL